ncbi:MAG: phosphomethylpyrimidine synthase ThiC [Candidatus Hadarchaeota archaeon]
MEMKLERAKKGDATEEMEAVADKEGVPVEKVVRELANGRMVIPKNRKRKNVRPVGIGGDLRTKVNANVGTSPDYTDVDKEIEKAEIAVEYGADTVMDLSIGGGVSEVRKGIISSVEVPIGTVPIYQAGLESSGGKIVDMTSDDIFKSIRKHAEDGVDFVTVHCGVTRDLVESLRKRRRLMDFVSRGGSFLAAWMIHNDEENPLYDEFDYLLDICKEYDLTLSLGDGLRPGCIADSSDSVQLSELFTLGELVEKSREESVQVMVEGPGHIPLDEVEMNVKLEKAVCEGAPFYVLGPLVTDIAPGYDHIVGAIGGALAAKAGADFLCYVTPSEHLCLPSKEDVRAGVVASKIAAHSADLARGIDLDFDRKMSEARRDFEWDKQYDYAIDPDKAKKLRSVRPAEMEPETCSMCSDLCALKMVKDYLSKET